MYVPTAVDPTSDSKHLGPIPFPEGAGKFPFSELLRGQAQDAGGKSRRPRTTAPLSVSVANTIWDCLSSELRPLCRGREPKRYVKEQRGTSQGRGRNR